MPNNNTNKKFEYLYIYIYIYILYYNVHMLKVKELSFKNMFHSLDGIVVNSLCAI